MVIILFYFLVVDCLLLFECQYLFTVVLILLCAILVNIILFMLMTLVFYSSSHGHLYENNSYSICQYFLVTVGMFFI